MQDTEYIKEIEEKDLPPELRGDYPEPGAVPAPIAQGQAAAVTPQRTLNAAPARPLPAADEHPDAALNRLERVYMDVTGESMSAETRANMYAFMQRFGIRSHDAIMCLVIANGHLDNRMQKLPHQLHLTVEKAARDVLDGCEKASADEAKRAATKLLQQVAEKIDEAQSGGAWRHLGWATPIFIIAFLIGNMFNRLAITDWIIEKLF
ncbi:MULTISPECIES: DUF6753 family protein [Desulfovibrio]|uniref:Uncharacterized protein n=1 Tax=Desulfovibrio desulfuricans TaxID=876 RepID=A0AA94HUJ7_DESDE|nr:MULTISPECIES: DUF6753 family protein [Desulfovibrio]ATD81381.1 hypothetical protein CNY67_08300 [Desulfovibrio sp. G11]SFW67514.1 hypothetical protein SAMN02910291_02441 [Desulfovibrio desulfuricans]SPD37037.1 Hypothetical protein DSVG11_3010 [Desulfovibrio sp. G11]